MNNGSRRCSTRGGAASAAWLSISIRVDSAAASRRWRRSVAGGRPSTGGSSVGLKSWSSRRRNGLLQVNPGTIVLLALAAIGGAWAAGLLRPHFEDGRLTIRAFRARRVLATFDFRDTGLLLLLALMMGWAVAAAVERSGWVPDTEGRLVPAMAITTLLGWVLIVAGISRAPLPSRAFSGDARLAAVLDAVASPQRPRPRSRTGQVAAGPSRSNQPSAPHRFAADVRPHGIVDQLVDLSPAQ